MVRPRTLRNSSLFFYKVMLHTKRFITRFDFQKEQRYLYPVYILKTSKLRVRNKYCCAQYIIGKHWCQSLVKIQVQLKLIFFRAKLMRVEKCCSFCYSCCFVAFATRFQIKQTDEQALLVIVFYYQPTFRPPIQVGFFRAMFSTTKHVAYQ